MLTLGIETSCDETSVAFYSSRHGVLSTETFSQDFIHARFGGVIPEVASRNHIVKIAPLFEAALKNSGAKLEDIDLIGVTNSPGLIGALFVGVTFAKAIGYSLKVPVLGINHLAGHAFSAELSHKDLTPPYIALVASGGHTHIYDVDSALNFKLLGRTIDDAAGEAFDKVAKVMGGAYPGGKFIQTLAQQGDKSAIKFPIAFRNEVKFSFSGLKTSVINAYLSNIYKKEDIAASFEATVAETLYQKTTQAARKCGRSKIVLGGGVACNISVRKKFEECSEFSVYLPEFRHSTDNGEMIAYAAQKFYKFRNFLGYKGSAFDTAHDIKS